MTPIRLSLAVTTGDPELIARTAEHFARAAAGLALEGVESFIMIGPDEDDS